VTFWQFLGGNKWLVRKPFSIPKNEHGIAWDNKSYATALDLNLGYYTIKIGLRCIQNLYHQSSFLGPIQPQELTIETTDSPDKQIVGANRIPRGCMSFPQGPPLHLLRQSWGPNRLLLDIFRQSRWILKQRCNADFEVYAKWIQNSTHLIKYLEAFFLKIVTKPRVARCRQYLQFNHPKGVITRRFHNMAQN
jgi:hypothetical protein